MSIKSDKWIRRMAQEHGMIKPFIDGQVKRNESGEGIVSYGLSSYGYDVRCSDEFKIFTNINSAIVDPKNFDANSFVDLKSDVCIIPPQLIRTGTYDGVHEHPAFGTDHLPRQIDLCPLRHYR